MNDLGPAQLRGRDERARPARSGDAMNDLNRLYLDFAPALEQIVRGAVRASDAVIEDACQVAWTRLVHNRHRINDEAARGWLTRTAVHEALRLRRRELRETPADVAGDGPLVDLECLVAPEPQHVLEQRQRLASVSRLPRRQQRLLWLRALGLSYEEVASHEGCTYRTVERQLDRARRRLRSLELATGPVRRAA
jgi:RNA polymerase sigma factor (sigma-70 family)